MLGIMSNAFAQPLKCTPITKACLESAENVHIFYICLKYCIKKNKSLAFYTFTFSTNIGMEILSNSLVAE